MRTQLHLSAVPSKHIYEFGADGYLDSHLQNTYCSSVFNVGTDHHFDQATLSCQTTTGQCTYTCLHGYTKCSGLEGCFNPCPVQPTGTSRRARGYTGDAFKTSVLMNSIPSLLEQTGFFCPSKFKACAASGRKDELECVDPLSDLRACGGCVAPGDSGVRCDDLEGVVRSSCNKGKCNICECMRSSP